MKIRILSPHSLGGGNDVFPGDVVDRPEHEARWKISRGWAEPVIEEAPAAPAPETPAAEPADPPADSAVLAPAAEEAGAEEEAEEAETQQETTRSRRARNR